MNNLSGRPEWPTGLAGPLARHLDCFPRGPVARKSLLSILLAVSTASASADHLRTVILSGAPAPGFAPGVTIEYVNIAYPAGNGHVAFGGWLAGPGVFTSGTGVNNFAMWREWNNDPLKIVQTGDIASGASDNALFSHYLSPITGSVAGFNFIWAGWLGGSRGREGIWRFAAPGEQEKIIAVDDSAPGLEDQALRIAGFQSYDTLPVANGNDQVAFAAALKGPEPTTRAGSAFWVREVDGKLRMVTRSGESVPELGDRFSIGAAFGYVNLGDSGRTTAFVDVLEFESAERSGMPQHHVALLSENGAGTLGVVARENNSAPGVDGGIFNAFRGETSLNSKGALAFVASTKSAIDKSYIGEGIWSDRTGDALSLVMTIDQRLPGIAADEKIFALGRVVIDDFKRIYFSAAIAANDGGSKSGLWIDQNGSLELVARTGDALPGPGLGSIFEDATLYPAKNRRVAMLRAFLAGAGVVVDPRFEDDGATGIWARDARGELLYVAREGDLLDVNDDPNIADLRVIRSVFAGGIDEKGYITFTAHFVDGTSGVFVSSIVAAPEPGAGLLLVIGVALGRREGRARSAKCSA